MDAKALAKSKRAHSQHHSKKPYLNQKSKAPVVSATAGGNETKPLGKQTREKSRPSRGSASSLPSNWDRYEEEYDLESEDPSIGSSSRADGTAMPKSKGADFGYLISEAQSQLPSQSNHNLESFGLFDDYLLGFNQGVSSMLSVRGQSILSWTGDDNFIVEDNGTADYDASFLSMDLHALAAQLEKVDISQRLFIEADLLPPELRADGSKESGIQESEKTETTHESEKAQLHLDQLAFHEHGGEEKITDNNTDPPFKNNSRKLKQTDSSKIMEPRTRLDIDVDLNSNDNKLSRFEAAAAEEELDMLLGSFSETKLFDSSRITEKHYNDLSAIQKESSTSFLDGVSSSHAPKQEASRITNLAKTIEIEDTIDALLEETYNPKNKKDAVLPTGVKEISLDLPSLPSSSYDSKSNVLDDFDSWLDTI